MADRQTKFKASTQEHLDIEDIIDDLVVLKTGWIALVMSTTAVNFDILSEAEQDATIYAYGALLNSLSFPIQILIRSKKADITAYFHRLEEAEATQPNPDLKRQIQKYQDFIQSTVQQKTVLDKKFYLIINYSSLEKGISPRGFSAKSQTKKASKAQLIQDSKVILYPKRDHLVKQSARLGLATKQLQTQELIELFYDIYNPAPSGTQRVLLDSSSYTTPLVQPAIEVPSPAPVTNQATSPQLASKNIENPQIQFGTTVLPRQSSPTIQPLHQSAPIQPAPIAPPPLINKEPQIAPLSENPLSGTPLSETPSAQTTSSQQEALTKLQEVSNLAKQVLNQQGSQFSQQNPQTNTITGPNLKPKP